MNTIIPTEVVSITESDFVTVAEPKSDKKTIDKRAYMREYKRKKYAENPDAIKNLNKMYYAKYKNNASDDDCKKYGKNLRQVIELRNALEQMNKIDINILKEIIAPYNL